MPHLLRRRAALAAPIGVALSRALPPVPARASDTRPSLLVDGMERLDTWSATGDPKPALALSSDHTEGQRSLEITIPAASTGGAPGQESKPVFVSHSYAALNTAPSSWDRLELDYRLVSGSLSWLGVKLGGVPGVDQAVWQLGGDITVPGDWQHASLPIAQPEDRWPGAMGQRVDIRTVAAGGARLLVDNLRFVKGAPPAPTPVVRTAANWRPGARTRPYLYLTTGDVAALRDRIDRLGWAGVEWRRLARRADGWLAEQVVVPADVGGWYHDYVCPTHGVRLVYDAARPAQHRCPVDNALYTGEKLDAAWRFFRHSELGNAARDLALAYAISGSEGYASRARDLLVTYARTYPTYRTGARPGAFQQTLDESVWLISLAHAYDVIYTWPGLAPEQHAAIELDLLRPAARVVRANDRRESNWQTWHNAAMAAAAAAVEDGELFDYATRGPSGLEFQLGRSILGDGFWWEGSSGYHFYALTALLRHLEVARRWGSDYYADPRVKAMFDAPLASAYPDLTLPATNDGAFGSALAEQAGLYELAFTRLGDPAYAWLLRQTYASGRQRGGEWALIYGAEALAASDPPAQDAGAQDVSPQAGDGAGPLGRSHLFSTSGLAVLRSSDGARLASLDFGPHGGGHGHLDKLHLDVFGAGRPLLADFGTPPYGHPLYQAWYRLTAAHNTVVVDGRSQQETTGTLVAFSDTPGQEMVQARADGAYAGVRCERRVRLSEGRVLDEFWTESDRDHWYDWLLHPLGVALDVPSQPALEPAQGAFGTADGYQYIALVSRGPAVRGWQGVWSRGGAGLRVTLLPPDGAEVLIGQAPGPASNPSEFTSVLVVRVGGRAARFAAVYEPFTGDPPPALDLAALDL